MSTTKVIEMRSRGELTKRGYPVKAGAAILQNQHIEISTGYARPWPSTPALGLVSGGIALESQDNTAGGNGDLWVESEAGEFLFPLDSFVVASVGELAFGVDEETVQPTNNGGTLSACGRVVEVVLASDPRVLMGEHSGAWISVGDIDDAVHKTPIKMAVTITHADLTAAATTQAIDLGGVLPAGARLLFVSQGEGAFTAFSGGGASSATVQLGTAADPNAITTAEDIFTGAVAFPKAGTAGVLGASGAPHGGSQIQALFTSDVNVAALTAGSISLVLVFDFPGT